MFYTYILKSIKTNRYYIGYTKNISERLKLHNKGKVNSTKHQLPWTLFHFEKYNNEIEAMDRERQIKSWKSRKAIERLKFSK